MRRALLFVAVTVAAAALVATGVLLATGDDGTDEAASTTSEARSRSDRPGRLGPAAPLETQDEPTTTSVVASSPGATPASGALLSQPARGTSIEATGAGDCRLDDAAVRECLVVDGDEGRFAVAVVGTTNAFEARLYAGADLEPVASSETFDGVEVVALSLVQLVVDGEPVVVVDYDFNGSGSVHTFDVVAWAGDDAAPRVVAFVDGQGVDRVGQAGDGIEFVSADYSDGSPTCCPQQALVRALERDGDGWRLTSERRPFSAA